MRQIAIGTKPDMGDVKNILSVLANAYPQAKIALRFQSPWELLVAVILSAQCTDVMVNKVTEELFRKYPTLTAYREADVSEFEKDIRKTGFYRNKAKNIISTARIIHEKFNDKVPDTMEELMILPGVARKTANVVLGNAYGIVEGIAVDTHVLRISQRLRLVNLNNIGGKKKVVFTRKDKTITDFIKDADPVKIEFELMKIVPKADWFIYTYRIIDHGRAICKAINPKCEQCPLRMYCPSSRI